MITTEIQVHGYRKGHQLLASSTILSREDQAVVDRLSDVAGPLRPKEYFSPYLTAYPLPSGHFYVIARTWQDLSVPRAGCVRTKSVLIRMKDWANRMPLDAVLRLLNLADLPAEPDAVCVELDDSYSEEYPDITGFNTNEFVEALFLEEPKPVVVFDAPEPELIARRLLAALWPDIRQRFALSTFALSPRRIGGRDLDLIFSPSNARVRFSDWSGRRVDGRQLQAERHRWTKAIAHRIFDISEPRLLSGHILSLLGDRDVASVSVLRVALLWDELFSKLRHTPSAALGLLDIANSGMVTSTGAIEVLEPQLVDAVQHVKNNQSPADGWEFLGAFMRKIRGREMPSAKAAVISLAEFLAEYAPEGAFRLLEQPELVEAFDDLLPGIAKGLSRGPVQQVKKGLVSAPKSIFARLVCSEEGLAASISTDDELIKTAGAVLLDVDESLSYKTGRALLPYLTEDRHLPAAKVIILDLTFDEIIKELCWLRDTNYYQSREICELLINRSEEVGALSDVREVFIQSYMSHNVERLLSLTLLPTEKDVQWILDEERFTKIVAEDLLVDLLRKADDKKFEVLMMNENLCERIISVIPDHASDILTRTILLQHLPLGTFIRLIRFVLPGLDADKQASLAEYALKKCLRRRFGGNESEFISGLLGYLGERFEGRWLIREGIGKGVDALTASRNMVIFEQVSKPVRLRIIAAVDEIANMLKERKIMDLTEEANNACAQLMFDAERSMVTRKALVDSANTLIPILLNARRQPVSLIIAALFPIVYHELEKSTEMPESVNIFFYFMDWDRCKTARNELIHSFLRSSCWRPGHLALTACRCGEASRMIKKIAQSYEGEEYLVRICNDLKELDEDNRVIIRRKIDEFLK
ncbi:hypothetical protein [Dickeya fangzhongdai]|uniref:GAP1-N1 domain-containing protein n=1 Tax=Dickeya fangzhongdai TaxID=1778540 RepID=UPI0026DFCF9E|nr:hypothetical protein [Dickeya fangzhongdai]WKV51521.1 hypothetical protein PL145_04505 [Dickeya fangzhongdai]